MLPHRRNMRLGKYLALGLLLIALKVCADEKLLALKVGDEVFSNVTVTAVTPTDIYFTYPGGMANAKLKKLSPELQKHFHYNGINAMVLGKNKLLPTPNTMLPLSSVSRRRCRPKKAVPCRRRPTRLILLRLACCSSVTAIPASTTSRRFFTMLPPAWDTRRPQSRPSHPAR
ncbi:MAG: hypothetical protein ACLP2Y_18190 [Limisphaerales bacterium]